MKFYIHHEESDYPYTLALAWHEADARTVIELVKQFEAGFGAAHPTAPPAAILLRDAEGSVVSPSACVAHVVGEGADLFAERVAPSVAASALSSAAGSSAAPAAAGSAASSSKADEAKEVVRALKPYIKAADEAWEARAYKKAAGIYTELIATLEKTSGLEAAQVPMVTALRRLGEIELLNERPDTALPYLEKAEGLAPKNVDVQLQLAEAHRQSNDAEEAVSAMRHALELVPAAKKKKKKSVSIALGSLLFRVGKRSEGGGLLTSLLQQDMDDEEALQAYGECALELGQCEDALKIYLRLIVKQSNDRKIKRMLARTVKMPAGVETLSKLLPASDQTASALAFVATVVKEHSGIEPAIALYVDCVKHAPENASYALNLLHLLELKMQFGEALTVFREYCERNPTKSIGTLALAEISVALPSAEQLAAHTCTPRGKAAAAAAPPAFAGTPYEPDLPAHCGAEAPDRTLRAAGSYGSEELDLLALCYAAAKILYLLGAVRLLPPLLRLIERARDVKDLHLTLVRNENAYYCCVAQLMEAMPSPPPTDAAAALPPVFMCGDSHSL